MQRHAAAASEYAGRPLDPLLTGWLTRCFASSHPGAPPGELERSDPLNVDNMKLAASQVSLY
jgi:hypothetical protein